MAVALQISTLSGCRGDARWLAPQVAEPLPAVPPLVPASLARRPAVLFGSADGLASLDLSYLRELQSRGLEIDYTDQLGELSEQRLQAFNVLVLSSTPDADAVHRGQASDAVQSASFVKLVERFVKQGGGVFLMPADTNLKKLRLAELYERWGATVQAERIVESDPKRVATLPGAGRAVTMAFTEEIASGEITDGVTGVWYPSQEVFLGAMTMPLVVDARWQVLVRASASATTRAIDLKTNFDAAPNIRQRTEPEGKPGIFAVRTLESGRIALAAQWPQFSYGAGTKLVYDRAVIDRGLRGRPSGFGRLFENTLRWLAAPSLESGASGGGTTPHGRLAYPTASEQVRAEFKAEQATYDVAALTRAELPAGRRVYRGLIGVRTTVDGRRTSVRDYAAAARSLGLDFLVFLDRFEELDPVSLASLASECKRLSGPDLLLLPGFSISNNLGNRMFMFAPSPAWPPAELLGGARNSVFQIQREEDGKFTGHATPFAEWLMHNYGYDAFGNVGYFDFRHSGAGMELVDARLYAAVGVRSYRDGKLIDDVVSDYLVTAAGTMPPAPFAVHEIRSLASLRSAARAGIGLTYVVAQTLERAPYSGVLRAGLRWSNQYDAMSVFASDGPRIEAWPGTYRIFTYGAEGFSPERSLVRPPLVVTSESGLEEVAIFDGTRLFRRVALHGARRYEQTLVLDGSLQTNLVLIAKDTKGRSAVSYACRSWAEGSLAPVFCGDRINDCGHLPFARGPWGLRLSEYLAPPTSETGTTWDGGPRVSVSALGDQYAIPLLTRGDGSLLSAERMAPIPRLEFADEASVGVQSSRERMYAAELERVVNPWNTFGPIDHVPTPFVNIQRYRQWQQPSLGVVPFGFAAYGVRKGVSVSLFTSSIAFNEPVAVRSLELASFERIRSASIVLARRGAPSSLYPLSGARDEPILVGRGDSFAVVGEGTSSTHLFVNRGDELRLKIDDRVRIFAGEARASYTAGSSYSFELAGHAFAAGAVDTVEQVDAYLAYIESPTGVTFIRGTRADSPGLVEVMSEDGAAEIVAPRVAGPRTLPVRISGLRRNWSAGLLQLEGYSAGFYGSAVGRFRSLAVDDEGKAYLPMHVELARAHVLAGHPIVADVDAAELFIQVTCLGGTPLKWHVSVNNAASRPLKVKLRQAMALPGLDFEQRVLTLAPGELRVLQ